MKKFFELYGIEPKEVYKQFAYNEQFGEWVDKQVLLDKGLEIHGEKNQVITKKLPEITADKILKLIDVILKSPCISVLKFDNNVYSYKVIVNENDNIYYSVIGKNISEVVIFILEILYDTFTPEERKQIKDIAEN